MNKNFVFALGLTSIIGTIGIYLNLAFFTSGTSLTHLWHAAILFLFCYPWKIGKNVYSLFGGFNSEGSVYSLIAIFQHAKEDAVSMMGILQISQQGESICIVGVMPYQKGVQVRMNVGAVFFQWSAVNSQIGLGIAFFQRAGTENGKARMVAGIVFHQYGGREACQLIGITLFQFSILEASQFVGFTVVQGAIKTSQSVGVVIASMSSVTENDFLSIGVFQSKLT